MHHDSSSLTPRTMSYIVFATSLIATLTSLYLLKVVGRRKILICGHILISLAHAGVAIFNIEKMNYGILACVVMFKFVYETSSGPVAWLYTAETTQDIALGFCMLNLWGVAVILCVVCPIMMA